MYRKFLINMTAIVTAFSMSVAPAVVASANEGDTITETVRIESNEPSEINSDIAVDNGEDAVYAYGKDVSVEINGDVSSSGTHEYTWDGETTKYSNPTVNAYGGAEVTINGSVTTTNGGIGVSAYGTDTSVTVNDGVNTSGSYFYSESSNYPNTSTGVSATSGAEVNVNNDIVTKDGGTGISADGEGTTVNLDGNVDASGVQEYTLNNETKYAGSTGVYVTDGTVNVTGNVVGGDTGASVNEKGTLDVGGSVTATGTDSTIYTWNEETQKYDIPHNTIRGTGVSSDGNGTIKVGKDINGIDLGVLVNPDNDGKKGLIIVEGAITTTSGEGIQISRDTGDRGGITYKSQEDYLEEVPTIVVGSIDSDWPVYASAYVADEKGEAVYTNFTQNIIEAINYIISVDEEASKNYNVTASGDNINALEGYNTININKAFSVAASLPDGFTISGGDNVSVTENGNGSFTLTLTNPKGGINIKAVLRQVENKETGETNIEVVNVSTDSSNSSSDSSSSAPASADTVPAGAIVVTPTVANAAGTPSPISGDKAARSLSLDLGKVTPIQYKNAVIENVAKAPANGALNIETDRVYVFDKKMIETFATRKDIDINVVFTHNGKKMKVTIPAGYDMNSLLDENGYCGFLRLLSILGGTEL